MNYAERAREVGELVAGKQALYGNSFGRSGAVLRVLYPNGISAEHYDDVLTIARVVDKLFRIATRAQGRRAVDHESPWQDIVGYGLLALVRDEQAAHEALRNDRRERDENDG